MAVTDKISTLVKNQFPDFYKEEGENFLSFIEAYYEYMEQNGKMTDAVRNLASYQDISTTTEDYIEYFINTFLPSVPLEVAADKKLMVKYISQGNIARGTLASYKLLFRALYNEDIEVVYPSEQILKVSDGDWRKDRYLTTQFDTNTYAFIGKTIKGTESQAEALVEDIFRRVIRGKDLMQIIVSNVKGIFNDNEPIRLLTDVLGTGHSTIVEAGIDNVTIITAGGEYRQGDVVKLISSDRGEFGKVVVTSTESFGGALTFSLQDGGSGFTSSTSEGGTVIEFIGGDGTDLASFSIAESDVVDRFAISYNTDLIGGNTVYGIGAPVVTFADGIDRQMNGFANVILSSVDFGFREPAETVNNYKAFRDHSNAVLVIANTSDPTIGIGASLFGVTSGANATVNAIGRAYNSTDVVLRINGYKNFTGSEKVNISTTNGTTVGTVSSFSGNTIGYHVLQFGNVVNQVVSEGDELVGRTSNAYGVVKKVISSIANGYAQGVGGADDRYLITVQVTANNTANLTSQFDTGPMKPFLSNEGLRIVGANTTVGNVVSTTSNTQFENIYTPMSEALNFDATTFGTISSISLPVGGSGYSIPPRIRVRENDIAALGIGEQYLTLQWDDVNLSTGNSNITTIDTNDRITQASSRASGDVKGGLGKAQPQVIQYANGTYESIVRVWQDFLQRSPDNIRYANNETVTINVYDSSYVPGTLDTRPIADTGTAKIVSIQDEGVLGENAVITASVGANGTISGLRVLDSGFSYRDNEVVLIETPNRTLATSATVRISLGGVANSEGYYATSRSHVSSLRGYIQDSRFYQEYSYQIISPLSLDRYRDYALELVHPAGQALFGKFRSQSNANIDVVATSNNVTVEQSNGTVSIAKTAASGTVAILANKKVVTGTATNFPAQFGSAVSNNVIIEIDTGDGIENIFVETAFTTNTLTNAILSDPWIFGTQTSANVYYANSIIVTGSSTNFTSEYANGDTIMVQTSDGALVKAQINKVRSNTEMTLTRNWTLTDLSGANAHYQQGTIL